MLRRSAGLVAARSILPTEEIRPQDDPCSKEETQSPFGARFKMRSIQVWDGDAGWS